MGSAIKISKIKQVPKHWKQGLLQLLCLHESAIDWAETERKKEKATFPEKALGAWKELFP